MSVYSPCVGTCKLDPASGYCTGCARTGDEIFGWGKQSPEWRVRVLEELPERLWSLGVTCRRIPCDTAMLTAFVARTLGESSGTWALASNGQPNSANTISRYDETSATLHSATDQLTLKDTIHALTFDAPDTPKEHKSVILAEHIARARAAKNLDYAPPANMPLPPGYVLRAIYQP